MADEIYPAHLADVTLIVGKDPATQRSFDVIKSTLCMHSKAFEHLFSRPNLQDQIPPRKKIQNMLEIKTVQRRMNVEIIGHVIPRCSIDDAYFALTMKKDNVDYAVKGLSNGGIQEMFRVLTDDDPIAFEVLLRIICHKISGLSDRPTPKILLAVTRLAEIYDLVLLVRSCFSMWNVEMAKHDRDNKVRPEQLCFIGWTLGLRVVFKPGWHSLVDRVFHDNQTHSYNVQRLKNGIACGFEPLREDLLPDGALDELCDVATHRIHTLHQTLQRRVRNFITGREDLECTMAKDDPRTCEAAAKGLLIEILWECNIPMHLELDTIENARRPALCISSVEDIRAELISLVDIAGMGSNKNCFPAA